MTLEEHLLTLEEHLMTSRTAADLQRLAGRLDLRLAATAHRLDSKWDLVKVRFLLLGQLFNSILIIYGHYLFEDNSHCVDPDLRILGYMCSVK